MHLSNNNKQHARGRPNEWTDEELMKLALDTKYKHHGKKLTPSFLERETKVGRNTWSRRMKDYIEELNNPVSTSISSVDSNEAILPSVDLIFKKYGNNKPALKNELLDLEILLYDIYKELKDYKLKEERYDMAIAEVQELEIEVNKQKKRADHYEQLYNNIVVSSVYPHLQDVQGSALHQHNIKDNLINMQEHKEKNVSLDNLTAHFPDTLEGKSQEGGSNPTESKKQKNIKELLDEFDI